MLCGAAFLLAGSELQMEGDHQNRDFEPYPYIPVFSYLIRSAPWHSSAPNLLRRTNTSRSAVVCSPVLTVEARLMQFRAFFSSAPSERESNTCRTSAVNQAPVLMAETWQNHRWVRCIGGSSSSSRPRYHSRPSPRRSRLVT